MTKRSQMIECSDRRSSSSASPSSLAFFPQPTARSSITVDGATTRLSNPLHTTGFNHIVLAGFMGVGKTTVGQALADLIDYDFVDLDEQIQQHFGSPAECFATEGENWFRQREYNVLRETLAGKNKVIATGGGTLTHPLCLAMLRGSPDAFCITLKAGIEDILERVSYGLTSPARPLLPEPNARKSAVWTLYRERLSCYEEFRSVETSGRSPIDIATEIATDARLSADGGSRSLDLENASL